MKALVRSILAAGIVFSSIQETVAAPSELKICSNVFQMEPTGNRRFELPLVSKLDSDKFESPVRISPQMKEVRAKFLSLLKNDAIRGTIASSLEVELRMASSATKRKIQQIEKSGRSVKYDVVIIGAGIHGVIHAASLMRENPNLHVLLIESSDTAAANFRLARDMFRINSSNRASSQSRLPVPGEGNINELPSLPIQVSDLTAEKYPSANDLAIPLVTGLYGLNKSYANVDVLFDTKVTKLISSSSGGEVEGVRIEFDGAKKATVKSQIVVATTGLGTPKIPFEVVKRSKTKEELAKYASLEKMPQIVTFEEAFRMLSQSSNPIEFFSGKKVGIVGSGDSANVFIEFLLGYAPKKAYGISDAQEKTPDRIYWFGQDAKTCEQFITGIVGANGQKQTTGARNRYAQIGTGFRSSSKDRSPILKSAPKVKKAVEGRRGREVRVELADGSRKDVDFLIVATGYEQQIRQLFEAANDANDIAFFDKNFDYVEGKTSISKGESVRIARSLRSKRPGSLSFVVTGPAAGKLPKDEELLGIIQNSVSIFNNAPRVESLAMMIAKKVSPRRDFEMASDLILVDSVRSSQTFNIVGLQESRLFEAQPERYVRSSVNSFFKYLRFQKPGNIEIDLAYSPETDSVIVRSSSGYDISNFASFLTQSRDVPNFIRAIARNSDSISGIKIKAQLVSESGFLQADQSSIVLSILGKDYPVNARELKGLNPTAILVNQKLPIQN